MVLYREPMTSLWRRLLSNSVKPSVWKAVLLYSLDICETDRHKMWLVIMIYGKKLNHKLWTLQVLFLDFYRGFWFPTSPCTAGQQNEKFKRQWEVWK